MAQVKLSGTLPKDDTGANGLDVLAGDLAQRPTGTYVIVGLVTTAKTVVDHNRGNARQPEIQFIAVEAVTDRAERQQVQDIIERCRQRRGGRSPDQLDIFSDESGRYVDGRGYVAHNDAVEV